MIKEPHPDRLVVTPESSRNVDCSGNLQPPASGIVYRGDDEEHSFLFSAAHLSGSTTVDDSYNGRAPSATRRVEWSVSWKNAITRVEETLGAKGALAVFDNLDREAILTASDQRIDECKAAKLQWKNRNGRTIYLAEVFRNINTHFQAWTKPADTFASYDQMHSAIPWGLIQVFMQLASAPGEAYARLVDGVGFVTRLMSSYDTLERKHVLDTNNPNLDLKATLTELYIAILMWLVALHKFCTSRRTMRFLRSVFPTPSGDFLQLMQKIEAKENAVINVVNRMTLEFVSEIPRRITRQATLKDDQDQQDVLKSIPNTAQVRAERLIKLSQWLQAVDTSVTFRKAVEICHPGTSTWILSRENYKNWLSSNTRDIKSPSFLWINSPPGFGKTVLCTQILQDLDYAAVDEANNLAAFFCSSDREEWRSTTSILRSWISKLIETDDRSFNIVFQAYSKNSIRSPTETELWNMLKNITTEVPCTLVLDGLDECSRVFSRHDKYDDNRSEFLQLLITELQHTRTRVLLSSRGHEYIRSVLYQRRDEKEIELYEQVITQDDTKQDVLSYIGTIMKDTLPTTNDDVRDDLTKQSAEKSEGMFLYVNLLKRDMKKGDTVGKIKRTISSMPMDLETVYKKELDAILMSSSRKEALAVFRWLLFATRPLTLKELAEALVLTSNTDSNEYVQDDLPDGFENGLLSPDWIGSAVISHCGAFVELRKTNETDHTGDQTVHFPHASMREFLVKSLRGDNSELGLKDSETEKDRLDVLCLRYLCYDVFGYGNEFESTHLARRFPFYLYAAVAWYERSQKRTNIPQDIKQGLEGLLNPKVKNWSMWSRVFEKSMNKESDQEGTAKEDGEIIAEKTDIENGSTTDDKSETSSCFSGETPRESMETNLDGPIYYASLLGLMDLVQTLKTKVIETNTAAGKYGTPLQAAAKAEHINVVDYLIQNGADVNQTGGYYGTALSAAASTGNLQLVEKLLACNADSNLVDDSGRNSLHTACRSGHDKIAEVLLQRDKDLINSITDLKNTPLVLAVSSGNLKLIKVLKDAGADMNALRYIDNQLYRTVISDAIHWGQSDVVRHLIRYGSTVEACNSDGFSNLMLAAQYGDEKSFSKLLEKGANIQFVNKNSLTLLHMAAFGGNNSILEICLNAGIAINSPAVNGIQPLLSAVIGGQVETIRMLVEKGADVNARLVDGSTTLDQALEGHKMESAKTLIDLGAEFNTIALFGSTAFDTAMETKSEELIEYMISKGALNGLGGISSINTAMRIYQSIREKTELGYLEEFDKMVQDQSEDIQGYKDSTLLIAVTLEGKGLVDGMIERGANVNCRADRRRTPLMIATRRGNDSMVDLLLNRGASAKDVDQDGFGAVHIAIGRGSQARKELNRILSSDGLITGKECIPADLVDLEAVNGTWTGLITSADWMMDGGIDIKVQMRFSLDTDPYGYGIPWSQFEGIDGTGEVLTIGLALKDRRFIFFRLNKQNGWFCEADMIESDDKDGPVIEGRWGEKHDMWHGTFKIHKEKEHEQEQETKSLM